ncbi:MAG: DUF6728 family protein [Cyclobacteriaceae bacterium]
MSDSTQRKEEKEQNSLKDYFAFGEVLGYFFRKKDPNRKTNFNLKMMHGINKISIIMFLLGLIFLVIKNVL